VVVACLSVSPASQPAHFFLPGFGSSFVPHRHPHQLNECRSQGPLTNRSTNQVSPSSRESQERRNMHGSQLSVSLVVTTPTVRVRPLGHLACRQTTLPCPVVALSWPLHPSRCKERPTGLRPCERGRENFSKTQGRRPGLRSRFIPWNGMARAGGRPGRRPSAGGDGWGTRQLFNTGRLHSLCGCIAGRGRMRFFVGFRKVRAGPGRLVCLACSLPVSESESGFILIHTCTAPAQVLVCPGRQLASQLAGLRGWSFCCLLLGSHSLDLSLAASRLVYLACPNLPGDTTAERARPWWLPDLP
jgi:hypothetical protein